MYTVYCDGYLLHDPRLPDYILADPTLTMEVNKAGSFTFTIYPTHPSVSHIVKLSSVVSVYQDGTLLWRGRVLDDTKGWLNQKKVTCEGSLAYLNDSMIAPFDFPDDFVDDAAYQTALNGGNVIDYFFGWILTQHNAQVESWQQIQKGNVTVTDPNNYITRSASDYTSAWDLISKKLVENLGGYIVLRHEQSGMYLDYLSSIAYTNTQAIDFGINLTDLSQKVDAAKMYTAMVPLGKEIDDGNGNRARVDVSSLGNGLVSGDVYISGKYVYDQSAVNMYGWICAPTNETTWNDVERPENLITRAVARLENTGILFTESLTIKAVDLHLTDDAIAALRCGQYVIVSSDPHDISGSKLLTKLTIKLADPQASTIDIGEEKLSLTDTNAQQQSDNAQRIEKTETDIAENRADINVVRNEIITVSTQLTQTAEEIVIAALKDYVTQDEIATYQSQLSQLTTTAEGFSFDFEQVRGTLSDLGGEINKQSQYIRLSNGEIHIGKSGSAITSVYTNDSLEFRYNGVTVAEFSNEFLTVRNVKVQNQLQLATDWAIRPGEYVTGKGYNLNDVWIGG